MADEALAEKVRAALAAHDVPALINISDSPEHLRHLVALGAEQGAERFLAVGGDGTASMVADALMGLGLSGPPVLGILPAGSGSDFVRTFGFSQRLEEAVRHLRGDETYAIDVGVAEGAWGRRHFINAVNVGVLGSTVHRAQRMSRRWGTLRYKLAFWIVLPGFPADGVEVTTERQEFTGKAITIVCANGQYFGAGVNIAPKATLVDGVLDLQVFSVSKTRIPFLYRKAVHGLHLSDPGVKRFRAGRISIRTESPWPVEVDGDPLGDTPADISVIPGGLRFKI
jgi:YegS/Rv2252/BmrU family lipid kinase